ncbi:MAG: DMT family transporter [Geminicoccaceae bacterium]|nr:DMT family transporter [Geminicoccaceae bacterium]HRY26976.1 DMT family transporter [Geminicoccaceae bacterium]
MSRRPGVAFAALGGNVQGALWLIFGAFFFSAMGLLVKLLGERLPSIEIAFFRAMAGLVMVLPLMAQEGVGLWRTQRLGAHFGRALLGTGGMVCGFYAFTHLPLAEATAISFTKPLFMVVLAALVLHETVRARRWTATAVGFLGVLLMLRPGSGAIELAVLVALLGAAFGALTTIFIKRLVATERKSTILAYLSVVGMTLTGLPMLLVWVTPRGFDLVLIVLMGVVGSIAQLCLMQAFKLGEASALAPFDYARLPFAAAFGWLIFGETLDWLALAGVLVIILSSAYIAWREAYLTRLGRR